METIRRNVVEIPVTIRRNKTEIAKKENVTFYARVSTDHDEQEESYERQKAHFEEMIKARKDWNYVEGYADQGISGTKSETRPEFMRMIRDCHEGKIDRILIKSISRFARNTVDTLKYVRELKELGVSIVFETQGIDTMTANGEILITILAALAEQESRTISTNIKWAYQKRFKDGRVLINPNTLGYQKDGDGYSIVEEEAEIVRFCYRKYIEGWTARQIADELNKQNKRTKGENSFHPSTVLGILNNEKYTGNAYMGKTYKPDVLSKKRLKNEGQATMYYIEGSHPAIISQETYDLVQRLKKDRSELRSNASTGKGKYSSKYPFSGLLICGECGSKFRRYGRNVANGYVYTWICIEHQKDKNKCLMLPIKEDDLYKAYSNVVETLCGDLPELVRELRNLIEEELKNENIEDLEPVSTKLTALRKEVIELFKKKNNKQVSVEYYQEEYTRLSNEINKLQDKLAMATNLNVEHQMNQDKLESILKVLEDEGTNYNDPQIMRTLIETIVVKDKHTLEFQLSCGINITETI